MGRHWKGSVRVARSATIQITRDRMRIINIKALSEEIFFKAGYNSRNGDTNYRFPY